MIEIKNLSYRYGRRSTDGIANISFTCPKKSVTALIGPSGAGKTTLLKCLSGEISDYQGEIKFREDYALGFLKNEEIQNKDITLFDFLFSEIKSQTSDEKKINQIRTLLANLELTNEMETPLFKLSSGQMQRTLIAKALINNPTVLLLDEPFANLDNNLRDLLLNDLFELLADKEMTIIWVTHNTEEALKYADQIALLQIGQLEQIATPKEIYYKPQNIFVAQFFGLNNILSAKIIKREEHSIDIEVLGQKFKLPSRMKVDFDDILVMIRPEFIFNTEHSNLKAEVLETYFQGPLTTATVKLSGQMLFMHYLGADAPKKGEKISISLNSAQIYPLFT